MKKLLLNGIYLSVAICGVFQAFILTGLAWNFLFPFIQFVLVLLSVKLIAKNKLLKISVAIIVVVTIVDLGLIIYSNTNTKRVETTDELKVMSYNLFFKNNSTASVVSIVKKENADLLMVQELTPKWNSILNKEIGAIYRYKHLLPLNGTHGIGIYSKYPISNPIFLNNSSNKPFALIADIEVNGKLAQIVNTHLASPAIAVENKDKCFSLFAHNYGIRKKQIIKLNKIAKENYRNYDWQLLVGDLNTLQSEPIFKKLKINWVNSVSYPLRWRNFNFPNSGKISPFLTLDYVLGRGKMKFLESDVIEGGSSDHLAITSRIRI